MTNTASPAVPPRLVSRLRATNSPVMQKYAPFLQASAGQVTPPVITPVITPDQSESEIEKIEAFEAAMSEAQTETLHQAPVTPPEPASPVAEYQPPEVTEVIEEAPPIWPQVVPTVVQQSSDTLNPSFAVTSAKEVFERGTFDQVTGGEVGGLQHVEQEVSPEISPEISEFIEKVETHTDQQPQEIVITAQGDSSMQPAHMPQPVVVLPITPEVETFGAKQKTTFSVRWLVEWSRKLMKVFSGKIIYRQT